MKKILFFMVLSVSFLFSINVQTASKDELMCIKGIGEKKAAAIMKYRKTTKLKSADDLINIKGFGKAMIKNVKSNTKSVACGGKKTTTKKKSNKKTTSDKKKSDKKKTTKKKSEKKTSEKKENSDKKKSDKKTETKKSE